LDPHQGIDDCLLYPTSKKLMWISGRYEECKNILVLHIL
jgi:hypothetical protein